MSSALECCNVITQALDTTNTQLPTFKIQNPGALAAFLTPENLANVRLIETVDKSTGRTIAHRAKYWQNPRAAATDGFLNFCTPGSTTGQKFKDYEVTVRKSVELTLDEAEFRTFCGSLADAGKGNIAGYEFAVQQIQAKLNQLIRSYSTGILTQAAGLAGKFIGGAASKTVNLLKTDGSVNANGEVAILRSFEDAELPTDNILAIGTGNLSEYWYKRAYACCSDAGVDVSKVVAPLRYFRDPAAASVLANPNGFLAFTPGAAVPYFSAINVGGFERLEETYTKTVINVPFQFNGINYNLPVDMFINYAKCPTPAEGDDYTPDSVWTIVWTLSGGLATIPDDIEPSGSPFEDVNNLFTFVAGCGNDAYCS